jgi:MFS family permease
MFSLYLFALIVGGGLLVYSLFGVDHHGGDAGHHGGDHSDNAVQWLSLRTFTYFLFVFGGVGAVLSKTWHLAAAPLVLILSIVAGVGVGAAAAAAFAYLRRSGSGEQESEDSFIGLTGRVTLPIGAGGMGKVLVQRGDRTYELLARPLDAAAQGSSNWKSVIVVEMNRGTALVAPLDDPAVREISSLSH